MKTSQQQTKQPHYQPSLSQQLMQAWVEAAAKWRQLRSDSTLAACVAARAAYYRAAGGQVPPLRGNGITDDAWQVVVQEDLPAEEGTTPLDMGMVVRLTEKARTLPAHQSIPADWFGVITGTYATPTGMRRFLVDPEPVGGGWGRLYVREEWLERVPPPPAAPAPPAPAPPALSAQHPETTTRSPCRGIEGALGIGDRVECVNHRSYTDGGGEIVGFEDDLKGRRRYRVHWASGTFTGELKGRIRRMPVESEATS